MDKRKIILTSLTLCLLTLALAARVNWPDRKPDELRLLYLKRLVADFSSKYKSAIVVSKKEHLLYYCENGRIVENESWNGFSFSFPVKISIANRWCRTPEGLVYIDRKNGHSRYTLFLGLSFPGAYGIHGASTYLASFLDKMERVDPSFTFVTKKDDTRGCVAVENRVIKYLFARVEIGTPVLILP